MTITGYHIFGIVFILILNIVVGFFHQGNIKRLTAERDRYKNALPGLTVVFLFKDGETARFEDVDRFLFQNGRYKIISKSPENDYREYRFEDVESVTTWIGV